MAEEKDPGSESSEKPAGSKLPLLIGLVNTLAILGALGTLLYTRVLYQRPVITETGERDRLAKLHAAPPAPAAPGYVTFEPFTASIRTEPPADIDPRSAEVKGKAHYVRLGFSMEVRLPDKVSVIEEVRPILMDQLLSMLGKKSYTELTTAQGRYLLRNEVMELTNRIVKEPLVTNVFFTEMVVQ